MACESLKSVRSPIAQLHRATSLHIGRHKNSLEFILEQNKALKENIAMYKTFIDTITEMLGKNCTDNM